MDTKKQILTKSESLFMRYGIKSVTMDDIARELGISKKTLYQFVENKADLIQKIFNEYIKCEKAEMDEIFIASANAIEEILNIGKYVIQQLRELAPTVMYDLQKYYRESWKLMQSLHQQDVYQVIKANLERGIKEGLYREDLDPDIIAKLYVGKTSLLVDEALFPLKHYDKGCLFKEYIKYHIQGIASPKGLKLFKKLQVASAIEN